MEEYKGFEIWKDDLGRWCIYNQESPYGRENDHRVYGSLSDAKNAVDNYKEYGYLD